MADHAVFIKFFNDRGQGDSFPCTESLDDDLYNKLLTRYANEVGNKWGGFPTKKGFEKWLQEHSKGAVR